MLAVIEPAPLAEKPTWATVNAVAQVSPSSSYSDEGGTSATMNVGEQRGPKEEEQKDGAATVPSSIYRLVENAASSNGLPVEFFARIISQESDFKPDAVRPLTRKGQRAQGIAQFMPETASERLLHDPFDLFLNPPSCCAI
jgi:soluble lytic murein transglycosylase-like protein